MLDRDRTISQIVGKHGPNALYITNTGYISRAFFYLFDSWKNVFYMQGSMGLAPAIGLGLAMNRCNDVVVISGDASLLMHLGITHTIRDCGLPNLFVYVLDNGCHESVGAQPCSPLEENYPGINNILKVKTSAKHPRVALSPLMNKKLFISCSCSVNNNAEQWQWIWKKRMCHLATDGTIPLFAIDGWDMLTRQSWEDAMGRIIKQFGYPKTVLEIGCGAGGFLESLHNWYKKIALNGFDISKEAIRTINKRLDGQFWVANTAGDWRFQTLVDLVAGFSVFQYFNTLDDAQRVLDKMYQLTKEGGMIYIGDVPDASKKAAGEEKRKLTTKSYKKFFPSEPKHLYYPKDFFRQISGCDVEIIDHDILMKDLDFPNSKYRYSVFIVKH